MLEKPQDVPQQIEWVLRALVAEDGCGSAEFHLDHTIGKHFEFFPEVEWQCKKLHGIFLLKENGKPLAPTFLKQLKLSTDKPLTFADLARFINDNYDVVRIEPVTIFGQPCEPASAFLAIEKLVRQVSPEIQSFGPSTPIRHRIRGNQLNEFITKIRLFTCGRLELSGRLRFIDQVASALTLLSIPCLWVLASLLGFLVVNDNWAWAWAVVSTVAVILSCFLLYESLGRGVGLLVGVLPARSYTFGDLARDVANACRER